MYDELSVVHMWKDMQEDGAFMRHFPDRLPKGRLPDREYFFNILMTVHGNFLIALIEHASKQRNEAGADKEAKEVINISEEWWAKLNAVPFKSCKSRLLSYPLQHKRGAPCTCSSTARRLFQQNGREKSSILPDLSATIDIRLSRARQDPRLRPTSWPVTNSPSSPQMWRCPGHKSHLSWTRLHIDKCRVENGRYWTRKRNKNEVWF